VLNAQVNAICLTDPDPVAQALARYSLEEALTRLGLPLQVATGEPSNGMIVYGPVPASWSGARLHFDRRCYDPSALFAPVGSPPLWAPVGVDARNVDLIGGIGRLLTLTDELQVAESQRNANGIFCTPALSAARRSVCAEPLVENHMASLVAQLRMIAPELPDPRPLWPAGRRYAVVVTHDTDLVTLNAPGEILFNAAKTLLRTDPVYARMAWAGLTQRHDPLSGFVTWAEEEKALEIRSAFFLSDRQIVPRHLNDPRSTVFNQEVDWTLLRSLADAGWEFGCHPPIRAKENAEEFVRGKSALEAHLERPVHGLRHHYLALDWRRPHLTFRQHVRAGFRYDTSIAWRDAPGFRAGTSLPYRPYDPELGRALELYQLPGTIMDAQVIRADVDPDDAENRAFEIIERVRRVGGMLALNWHTESAMDRYRYRNQSAVLKRLLRRLREDSDAWFTVPWELTQHWMERQRRLSPETVM
jgi:hypothetical protein